ncbi:hypothetical protein HCN44_004301 [Aphidius gifuensis]|uniref:Uncharacterized protein n=1 Tax=Aphidius gifuensis TaxID=684658 RepID=A0A835CSC0_APHGI|nr:uncharacterized protein LOC122848577 [Aphidius gifuensis]KAF7994829.1 hypothetical protein HCN44_004301 [Aphidius gifuensis]
MGESVMSNCCKEKLRSSDKNDYLQSNLRETLNEMSKRECELIQTRHNLTQNITSLEQAIAITAYKNLSSVPKKNKQLFLDVIKNLVDELTPYPHPTPTDKLLEKKKLELKKIDEEIEVLHKQVLDIEIKLEESEIELESLEAINNELDEKLKIYEKKMLKHDRKSKAFPDLSSVVAEDLVCLGKLRGLVEQELRLKNCINMLEARENSMKIQLNKFMTTEKDDSCPRPRKLKNKKLQKRRNKHKIERVKAPKKNPCVVSKKLCHCGSTESFNLEDTTLSDDDDDTSSEEFCDCCDCEMSTTTTVNSSDQ